MNNHSAQLSRLDVFDGLRGHLLIGMLVAHLSFQDDLDWLINFHHNKLIQLFDAEFFVLIAGLLVGHLFSIAYKTSQLRLRFIINRLSTIYRYYILSALPFFVFSLMNGAPVIDSILGVLSMQMGGWYSDILPIYFVCFVLVSPFAVILILDRPFLIFSTSAVIYGVSQFTNLNGFFGFSGGFVAFDIAAWQFLFICAILVGQRGVKLYHWVNRADARTLGLIFLIITVLSVLLRQNNFYPNPLMLGESLGGNSPRMGLHPLFLIRILLISGGIAIILIRGDFWIRPIHMIMHLYFGLSIIRNVGKYSIQMFVVHVYIMALYQIVFWDDSGLAKGIFAIFSIVVFIGIPNFWVILQRHILGQNKAA